MWACLNGLKFYEKKPFGGAVTRGDKSAVKGETI